MPCTTHGCVDIDAVIGGERESGPRIAPADSRIDIDVAEARSLLPHAARRAGGRLLRNVGSAVERLRDGRCGRRIDSQVLRIDEPRARLSGRCAGVDFRGNTNVDRRTGGFHRATVAATRSACVKGAPHIDCTGTPAKQDDRAIVVLHGLRLDDTRVIDHACQHRVLGACGHEDLSAVSLDKLAVLDQIAELAGVNLQMEQSIAAERERLCATRAEGYGPELRTDHALIGDLMPQQGNIASRGCVDRALVGDRSIPTAAEFPRVGRAVADQIEGRGHQAADVDLRVLAEQHPIGVDQPDLAVRIQVAQNFAARRTIDAIDRQGAGVRLNEIHRLLRTDVEALPIERQRLAALLNGGRATGLADLPGARGDLAARGARIGNMGADETQTEC